MFNHLASVSPDTVALQGLGFGFTSWSSGSFGFTVLQLLMDVSQSAHFYVGVQEVVAVALIGRLVVFAHVGSRFGV